MIGPTWQDNWLNDLPVFREVISIINVFELAKANDDRPERNNTAFFTQELLMKKFGATIPHL